MSAKDIGPLDWRIGIVDKAGRPTPEFQRRWNEQRNNNALIGAITIGSGPPPVSPAPSDGTEYVDTSTSPYTLYIGYGGTWHQVGEVLDLIGDTQGDILYRDATHWTVLPAGVAGEVLTTSGPGADPLWQGVTGFTFACSGPLPANTMVGIGSWTKDIVFHNADANNNGTVLVRPAANYQFRILNSALAQVGYIQVTTAGVWSVVWTTDPFPWSAGLAMQVWTQAVADTSFAGVSARVVGYF